ncbi:MAG: amino acid adenylation domain-containing protein [Chthoniobacterales bacterium]|nr:amino acid adenylation domain-containing protein [Chthoniobacterales bacterium]
MSVYPHNVYDLFRKVIEAGPDHAALVWSEREVVTFGELDRLSSKIASYLQQEGIHKGDRICLRLEKCTLTYALIVACLKLGAPYFVVDPSNPVARVFHMLGKCKPSLVFSAMETPLDLPGYRVVVVDQKDQFGAIQDFRDDSLEANTEVVGTDAAYIMFTSGSTGFPKGAVMSHANLLNFVQWAKAEFSVTTNDIFTNVNPLFFDNSVFDFYASIMNGASLVPFDAATMRDPYAVLQRIDELRCTIYFSVPSLLIYFQTLKTITPTSFAHVRSIIFGGEGYPKVKLKDLFDSLSPRVELVNVYGPTECTCICSAYRISAADFKTLAGYPPLGGPIANFSFTILNEAGEPAAPDEAGELLLGGPCVGLGYFDETELTENAFRQNPLRKKYHERVYATGDLVLRAKDDGKVHFVGRKDSQIKHQGYRIELEEIEHALRRIAGIDEAVALHYQKDGFSTIVAIVASQRGLETGAVRQEVSATLPAYMVPSRIELLERLPKNANGKIDRTLLKSTYS